MPGPNSLIAFGQFLAGAATFLTAMGVLLNRTRIGLWLASQVMLVGRITVLESEILTARRDTADAIRSRDAAQIEASSWRSIAQASEEARDEVSRLLERVAESERRDTLQDKKIAALVKCITERLAYESVLEKALAECMLPLPPEPPPIPSELQEVLRQ